LASTCAITALRWAATAISITSGAAIFALLEAA
jgi:hypothetical protein